LYELPAVFCHCRCAPDSVTRLCKCRYKHHLGRRRISILPSAWDTDAWCRPSNMQHLPQGHHERLRRGRTKLLSAHQSDVYHRCAAGRPLLWPKLDSGICQIHKLCCTAVNISDCRNHAVPRPHHNHHHYGHILAMIPRNLPETRTAPLYIVLTILAPSLSLL